MYSEKVFKNYIFWTKVRRIFVIIVLSAIGCFIGIFLSDLIKTLLVDNDKYRVIIIPVSTLLFFLISLLLTIGTAREVQDGYWKIAVLRKLTTISKKLDNYEIPNSLKNDIKKDILPLSIKSDDKLNFKNKNNKVKNLNLFDEEMIDDIDIENSKNKLQKS